MFKAYIANYSKQHQFFGTPRPNDQTSHLFWLNHWLSVMLKYISKICPDIFQISSSFPPRWCRAWILPKKPSPNQLQQPATLKIGRGPNRKLVFQPSIFKHYVIYISFREGNHHPLLITSSEIKLPWNCIHFSVPETSGCAILRLGCLSSSSNQNLEKFSQFAMDLIRTSCFCRVIFLIDVFFVSGCASWIMTLHSLMLPERRTLA